MRSRARTVARNLDLLKESHKHEYVHPPLTDSTVGTLPELPQDILIAPLPQSLSAFSWRFAYTCLCDSGKYKQWQMPAPHF